MIVENKDTKERSSVRRFYIPYPTITYDKCWQNIVMGYGKYQPFVGCIYWKSLWVYNIENIVGIIKKIPVFKVFKLPKIKWYNVKEDFYNSNYFGYTPQNKWFNININDSYIKRKVDHLSYEASPYIQIDLFKNYHYLIGFDAPDGNDYLYWEAIEDYLYSYNNDIVETYKYNIWTNCKTEEKTTILPYLRNKYKEIIKQSIET